MNQKQMELVVYMMQTFLVGLSFGFDSNFYELEEIAKRALLKIEVRDPKG